MRRTRILLVPVVALAFSATAYAATPAGTTVLASTTASGAQADATTDWVDLSWDGRYVAFSSFSTNLVPGDTNNLQDIFLKDLSTGATRRLSVDSAWKQANGQSFNPILSADGKVVAFWSVATNLVPGDTNGRPDIYVRNRGTHTTTRASTSSGGAQADADSYSYGIGVSRDGRFVVFSSPASNLVPGDTNGAADVFRKDLSTGETSLVSVGAQGEPANGESYLASISPDGRFVAFTSYASNLVQADTNATFDVFVRDLLTGRTIRASTSSGGDQADFGSDGSSLSQDGHWLVFGSEADNIVIENGLRQREVYLRDNVTGTVLQVSRAPGGAHPNGPSYEERISADGRFVVFRSAASNLVADDRNGRSDVFEWERATGRLRVVSVVADPGGYLVQPAGSAFDPAVSKNGQYVAFVSSARTIVTGDDNGSQDAFVWNRLG